MSLTPAARPARRVDASLDDEDDALKHVRMQRITAGDFEVHGTPPALADDEVHLWLIERPPGLSPRAVSVAAHAEVGRLLMAYAGAGAPPALARDTHGKPYVLDAGHPHFNLSHGGERIAIAFARRHAVGVDVEALQRRHSPLDLAERFFAADEARTLAAFEVGEQQAAFVHLWTCKEAVLKALGRGLAFGLDRLRFDFEGTDPHALVAIAEDAGDVGEWQVTRFDAGSGHAGALAWRGPRLRVRAMRGR
jgi:4'-phosphopantetheinyl transferase